MKVLNLYSGIGGNRKLWEGVEVTAIELDPKIAAIYKDFFPQDDIIVADAHAYLLKHFEEYDFIWSSPPCPSHSSFRKSFSMSSGAKPIYPDMKLYEEILLLKHYFKGKWVVENVIGFYEPLIRPSIFQRHYFWHNFHISERNFRSDTILLTGGSKANDDVDDETQIIRLQERHGFDLSKYGLSNIAKRTSLRNCVRPELGLHILNYAKKTEPVQNWIGEGIMSMNFKRKK